jgi:hypothetical protein
MPFMFKLKIFADMDSKKNVSGDPLRLRSLRRARKLRRRLRAGSGVGDPIWDKPKGMHWRTFDRLKEVRSKDKLFSSAAAYDRGHRFISLFETGLGTVGDGLSKDLSNTLARRIVHEVGHAIRDRFTGAEFDALLGLAHDGIKILNWKFQHFFC